MHTLTHGHMRTLKSLGIRMSKLIQIQTIVNSIDEKYCNTNISFRKYCRYQECFNKALPISTLKKIIAMPMAIIIVSYVCKGRG